MISWATLSFIIHFLLLTSLLILICFLVSYISSPSFVMNLENMRNITRVARRLIGLAVEFYKKIFTHLIWYTTQVLPILVAILIVIKLIVKIYFNYSTDDKEFIFVLNNSDPFGFKFSGIYEAISFNNLILKIKFLKIYEPFFVSILIYIKLFFLDVYNWVSSITKSNLTFALKFIVTLPFYFIKYAMIEGFLSFAYVTRAYYVMLTLLFWPVRYLNYNEKMHEHLVLDLIFYLIIYFIIFIVLYYKKYKIKESISSTTYCVTRSFLGIFFANFLIRLVIGLPVFFKNTYNMQFPYSADDFYTYLVTYSIVCINWARTSYSKFLIKDKTLFQIVKMQYNEDWQGCAIVGCLIFFLYFFMIFYVKNCAKKTGKEESMLEDLVIKLKTEKATVRCARLVFICLLASFIAPRIFNFFIIYVTAPFTVLLLQLLEVCYYVFFWIIFILQELHVLVVTSFYFGLVTLLSLTITSLIFLKLGILKKNGYTSNLFSRFFIKKVEKKTKYEPNSWQKQQHACAVLTKIYNKSKLRKKYSFKEFVRLNIRSTKEVDPKIIELLDKEELDELASLGISYVEFVWKTEIEKNEIRKEGLASFKKKIEEKKSKIGDDS